MSRKKYSLIAILILIGLVMYQLYRLVESDIQLHAYSQKKTPGVPEEVRAYVNTLSTWLDSAHNVGAAVTIVKEGRVILTQPFGLKEADGSDSIDVHTTFRLASVSKGFAGVLACLLEQDSVFSLNDKISSFMPDFRLKDSANTADLTLLHTLSHTSGLVPHAFDNLIEDGVPLPLIIEQLPQVEISAPAGRLYGYQNVVFSMLDTIVRIQTGNSYADMLERRIFRPLKMRDASATKEVFLQQSGNVALPHARTRNGFHTLKPNLGYYNISPAAGVNASISDMSKWLLALMGYQPKILDSTLTQRLATPVVQTPLKRRYTRRWGKVEEKYYSLGWRIYDYKGRRIVYHGGYVRGYRAEIAFCPEAQVGIAFLQNSPNWVASMAVPTFFNYYFEKADSARVYTPNNILFEGMEWYEDSFLNVTPE